MKNVLILSSSPRKGGNTDLLCDEFAKGAKEAGNKVTKIRIADKKIGYCTGCYACQKTHKCVIKDDAAAILKKMQAADVIVFGTPAYFLFLYGTAQGSLRPHGCDLSRSAQQAILLSPCAGRREQGHIRRNGQVPRRLPRLLRGVEAEGHGRRAGHL